MTPEAIRHQVSEFRGAIERCDPSTLPIRLQDFPRGSCADATLLLGTYLAEIGVGTFEYVEGDRGEGCKPASHAWLEGGGLIIDITADQFAEVSEPVIIAETSAWHQTFKVLSRSPAHIRDQGRTAMASLGQAYTIIVDELHRQSETLPPGGAKRPCRRLP